MRPRRVERSVQVGLVGKTPHVVLDEPQRGVRDDVVEPVIRDGVVRDEAQAVRRAVAEGLAERVLPVLGCDSTILVAHRAADPGHVVLRDEAPQRRDEPAAATLRDPLAGVRPRVREGTAVRDDDQLSLHRHR